MQIETAEEKCREVPHFLLHKFTNVNILLHLFYLSLYSYIVYLTFWMFKIKLQDISVHVYVHMYACIYTHTHIFTKTHAYKNKLNEHIQEINIDVKLHWILLSLVPVMEEGHLRGSGSSWDACLAWVTLSLQRALINNSSLLFVCLFLKNLFLIMCIHVYGGVDVSPVPTNARKECRIPWSCSYRWLSNALYGRWVLN